MGKSTLLTQLTGVESEAADYEFTTLTCIPGVMYHEGARIQILDLPGIIEGARDGKGRGRQVVICFDLYVFAHMHLMCIYTCVFTQMRLCVCVCVCMPVYYEDFRGGTRPLEHASFVTAMMCSMTYSMLCKYIFDIKQ